MPPEYRSTRSESGRKGAIVATVVVPVVLFYFAAVVALLTRGLVDLVAGQINHSMQGAPFLASVLGIAVFVPALWGIVIVTRHFENDAFGDRPGRAYTRMAAVALIVALGVYSGFFESTVGL